MNRTLLFVELVAHLARTGGDRLVPFVAELAAEHDGASSGAIDEDDSDLDDLPPAERKRELDRRRSKRARDRRRERDARDGPRDAPSVTASHASVTERDGERDGSSRTAAPRGGGRGGSTESGISSGSLASNGGGSSPDHHHRSVTERDGERDDSVTRVTHATMAPATPRTSAALARAAYDWALEEHGGIGPTPASWMNAFGQVGRLAEHAATKIGAPLPDVLRSWAREYFEAKATRQPDWWLEWCTRKTSSNGARNGPAESTPPPDDDPLLVEQRELNAEMRTIVADPTKVERVKWVRSRLREIGDLRSGRRKESTAS